MSDRYLSLLCALSACGAKSTPASPDSGEVDASVDARPIDAGDTVTTFSYTPGWSGVQSVVVLGGFGLDTDWTEPIATLNQVDGVFSGTATLPPGTYPYVFQIIGDNDAGTKSTTYPRFAVDPTQAAFTPCPMLSPTYDKNAPNPCSQITVPSTAPTLYHVTGSVTVGGAAAAGYLVVIERDEPTSHHFFANRVTTGPDGTYDLEAAATGSFRIQVQNPQYESATDADLDPTTLNILKREISSSFVVSADTALSAAEQAFAGYANFAPVTTGGSLPTAFTFSNHKNVTTKFDVYGTAHVGASDNIGDPWYNAAGTGGSASFDGTFNTQKAMETAVATGERYFWGIEEAHKADANGLVWTGQTLVFPITWQ
jgi:hypothetical protein